MSRDAESLIDYLGHILQAIERIETYTEDMDEVVSSKLRWYKMR